jgi:hypothetical protein
MVQQAFIQAKRQAESWMPIAGSVLQRNCEKCPKKKPALHHAAVPPSSYSVPPIVQDVLRSPGQPLDPATRAFMEPRFGHDFSRVRVHMDAKASESARAVNALAYTVGRDVVFGAGEYAPMTDAGMKLIAHELTHTVQQGANRSINRVELSLPNSHLEREAERTATGIHEHSGRPGVTDAGHSFIQRDPIPGSGSVSALPQPIATPDFPSEAVQLGPDESITAENPKLIRIAKSFKLLKSESSGTDIELSAYLSEGAKMSSAKESDERAKLVKRMSDARNVLQSLGIPRGKVSIQPPFAYSSSASGQIAVDIHKERLSLSPLITPSLVPSPAQGAPAASKGPSASSSLGDLLKVRFGPLTVDLPKSIALKMPIPVSSARSLIIDINAGVSGTFSFSITIDGLPFVRVSAKTGASYDKDKGFTGSAGLQIQLTRTVCSAPSPEALKATVTAAGDKLKKAMQEYGAETDQEKKLSKLADIVGAVAEMYDAVDKAKSGCKQIPAATFEFGVKGPLGSETDPTKREPSYIGGSVTIPF